MAKAKQIQPDLSTEEKIKEAARKVFMKKGFAATRTRDIAEEAGLNLALINYYFRSKKNLFEIVMAEKLGAFFIGFLPLMLTERISLDEKVKIVADNYINLLLENPDLPVFVFNAIHTNPQHFAQIVKGADSFQNSPLAEQVTKKNPGFKFEHFFMNIMALCIFPFIMRPGIEAISKPIAKNFPQLMEERKELIPKWIEAMLKVK